VIHAPQAVVSISNVPILVAPPIPPLGRRPPNHQTRLSTPATRPGGARTSMLVASSRARTCPKIFAINCGSSAQARTRVRFGRRPRSARVRPWRVQAMTRSFPPHSGQVSMSIAKTRLRRCIHWTGSPGAAEHRDVRERPAHGGGWFVRVDLAPGLAWHDAGAVFAVGCEYPMKSSQIQPWPGDQSGQPRHEVQRFQ
jgi:hypothetical protein